MIFMVASANTYTDADAATDGWRTREAISIRHGRAFKLHVRLEIENSNLMQSPAPREAWWRRSRRLVIT